MKGNDIYRSQRYEWGTFSFLRRAQKAPVVISDRSLTRPILMCERKGPVLTRDPCLYGNSEKEMCAKQLKPFAVLHYLTGLRNDSLKSLNCPPTKKETPTLTRNPVSSKTKLKDHNLYQVAKSICKSSVDICDPGAHKQL